MSQGMTTCLQELESECQYLIQTHPNATAQMIEILQRQETSLIFTNLSNDVLLELGISLLKAVEALPAADFKPVVIDVQVNGRCIFHYAMPHTSRDNEWWIERKRRTTLHFEKSSYLVGRELAYSGKMWAQKYEGLDVGEYAGHGGCFPIRVAGGTVVGTITMSGLAQVLDHVMIVGVLKKVIFGQD